MSARVYAHSLVGQPESSWELLADHLEAVAKQGAHFAAAFDSAAWGKRAGLWHDVGKYLPEFQDRLRGSDRRVDHAAPGAGLALGLGGLGGLALAFAIAGHHTGLANYQAQGDSRQLPLKERIENSRAGLARVRELVPAGLTDGAPPSPPPFLTALPNGTRSLVDSSKRRIEFWTRFLFSALVDADYLATERFYDAARRPLAPFDGIAALRERLDAHLARFESDSPVNRMRASVLADCRAAAERPSGIFSLSVPTGGGKTLSGMAFALRHAELHGLRRVIVAIPFTSIIEQNARVYAEALGAANVIEHHSALDEEKAREGDEEGEARRRLAAENWDAPVVVTTNVQFFESLFANAPGRCRKLHNVARSVIVLDEAQTLPPEFLDCALDALRELVSAYGCSVVLCTATQPALTRRQSLPGGFEPGTVREIIDNPAELARALERVHVRLPEPGTTTSYEELAPELARHERMLAIVHLRQDARKLARLLPEANRFHLSALMCAAHRTEVLAAVKVRLNDNLPCRLVATQLIEAGVDIDFPVVFRTLAGLDSVAQAAGRCNREGKLERGELVVFRAETKPPPGLLRIGLESAEAMLDEHGVALRSDCAEQMEEYFRIYYSKCRTDAHGVQGERERLNFANVADCVKLIDDGWSCPIVVLWRDAEARVRAYERQPGRDTARALQPFLVQISRRTLERLQRQGAIESIGESVHVLATPYRHLYDEQFGLVIEDEPFAEPAALVG
jgi:CRISPR-associated endonuclease/helicase Cas3